MSLALMYNACTTVRNQNMYRFMCKDCEQQLYLDDKVVSPNNKRIPLNIANSQPHRCPNRKYSIPCRDCKEFIYFDDFRISKNGKKIPINTADGLPHDCLKREFGGQDVERIKFTVCLLV